jgi:hypothetical protein
MDGLDLLTPISGTPGPRSRLRPKRKALMVLGMHRSGTSLITHVLHCLGAAIPHDCIGSARGNPLGHWEPRALVALNDKILGQLGRRWDDPRPLPDYWFTSQEAQDYIWRIVAEIERGYADAPLLVIKDPRLCRLLPLYVEALEVLDIEPAVVLQVRPKAEVIQSLIDRDDLPPGLSELLWLRSITEAEWFSRACPRVWVSFRQMITDWRGSVDRIGDRLGITWPIQPDDAADRINLLLNPRPRQIAPSIEDGALARAWNAVQTGLANDDPAARAGFDRVRVSLQETDRLYVPAMSHHVHRLEVELHTMRTSTCWRLTAPLRALKRLARVAGRSIAWVALPPFRSCMKQTTQPPVSFL